MEVKLISIIPGSSGEMSEDPSAVSGIRGAVKYEKYHTDENSFDMRVLISIYMGGIGEEADEFNTIEFIFDVKDIVNIPKAIGVTLDLCRNKAVELALPIYREMESYQTVKITIAEGKETKFYNNTQETEKEANRESEKENKKEKEPDFFS